MDSNYHALHESPHVGHGAPAQPTDHGDASETLHESPPSSHASEHEAPSSDPNAVNRAQALIAGFVNKRRAKKNGTGTPDTTHASPLIPASPSSAPQNLADIVKMATGPKAELRGQPKKLPRVLLTGGYHSNSYFAKRLNHVMIFLVVLDIIGILLFWATKDIERGGLRVHNLSRSILFERSKCYDTDDGNCRDCSTIVTYSMVVYHMLPIVIMIGLPASGIRTFEPFKRELRQGGDHKRSKVKRSLYLQACELVAVLVVIFNVLVFIYFVYSLLEGTNFNCGKTRVHFYVLGAIVSYLAVFLELTYFARFREHLKMQLGAFKEADQTGDVRSRLTQRGSQYRSERSQVVRDIRKKLFKAAELGSTLDISVALVQARRELGENFADELYSNASLFFRTFGHSKKNPLHIAAYHGNIPIMDMLLKAGFQINALDKISRVRFSSGDLFWFFAQYFIAKPAQSVDEDAVSVFKTTLVTPLYCAVRTGQIKAVQWLIDRGADVNLRCESSYSSERVPPLFAAEIPEIVSLLMRAGANHLEVPDPGHMNTLTVLQLAYMRGNIPVARELEDWGGDVALTPLHTAAANNNTTVLSKLLRKGADPNTLGEHGYVGLNRRTPLHWAAINGAYETAELLLKAGADPNFQDIRGRTPLHWAARVNRLRLVELLLEYKAETNIHDYRRMTPILCAALAAEVSEQMLLALVRAGANINDELPNGDTPLHIAMKKENRESALTLISCGADIMHTNVDGMRPTDCTTSTTLQFEAKRAAGNRDVMISYTHSHAEFAQKLRRSLEAVNITTWLDQMDPSGIGGGSVWREEIARGIQNAALVVCILTEDYAQSEWCLKELALAKECGTPIMAVSTERAPITEELQVYVYTRQMVPFEPAITSVDNSNKRNITYTYDEQKFAAQFRLLLDGVRDEVEKHRKKLIQISAKRGRNRRVSTRLQDEGDSSDDDIKEIDLTTISEEFVFLSHGDHHRAFSQRVYDRLTDNDVLCFFDGAQGQTEDMAERIHIAKEAILKCSCFIVIISNRTAKSELVSDQLAFAEDKGKPILPIMLNDLDLTPDKLYQLSRTKLLHFTPALGFNASFASLLSGVREHVPVHAEATGSVLAPMGSRRASRPTLLTAAARARALGRMLKASAATSLPEDHS